MSQFPSPQEIFNGSTDYNSAETIVKEMESYLNSQNIGCCSTSIERVLTKVSPMLIAMGYDAPDSLNNTQRWHDDIEAIYRILWPLT